MTLAGDTLIDATNAGGSAGGGNINFGSLTGAFDLAVNAGTGGAIAVNTTTNITDLTLTRATGTTFTGNVTVNDLITTANSGTITLNGAANTFVAAVDFLNTGLVTLGDAGTDSSTFAGGVAFGGNAASALQGAFVTTNTLADFGTGGVTLGADTTITTGAGAGNIAFGAGIAGAFDLGLTAGTGAVTVATTTNITDLTLTSATSNTFTGNVTVNDLITTANSGTITLNGAANTFVAAVDFLNTGLVTLGDAGTDSSTFAGGVAFGGNAASALQGAFVTTNTLADFGTGGVTLGADTTITTGAGAGNIAFGAGIAGAFDLGLTAGTGAVTVATTTNITDLTLTSATSNTFTGNVTVNDLITTANSGTITLNGAANTFVAAVDFLNTATVLGDSADDVSTFTGGLSAGGGGTFALQGTVNSTDQIINFGVGAATVNARTTINSVSAGGPGNDVVFGGTLTATAGGNNDLIITAGADRQGGDITFTGAAVLNDNDLIVGSAKDVQSLSTVSAQNIDIRNVNAVFAGSYSAVSNFNVDANTVRVITVSSTNSNIQANNSIINVANTSDTLTVRGNNSVVLINTTVGGLSTGNAWRNVNLIHTLPRGKGRYTVNGMPFGPERARLLESQFAALSLALSNRSLNLTNIGAANNTSTTLDKIFSSSVNLMPYVMNFNTTIPIYDIPVRFFDDTEPKVYQDKNLIIISNPMKNDKGT